MGGQLREVTSRVHSAELDKFPELRLVTGHVIADPLVEQHPGLTAVVQHVGGESRVADRLVAEADAVGIDEHAAQLDRGPARERAVRIGDGRIGLISADVLQPGAELTRPDDRFAGRAAGAEVLGLGDVGQ